MRSFYCHIVSLLIQHSSSIKKHKNTINNKKELGGGAETWEEDGVRAVIPDTLETL